MGGALSVAEKSQFEQTYRTLKNEREKEIEAPFLLGTNSSAENINETLHKFREEGISITHTPNPVVPPMPITQAEGFKHNKDLQHTMNHTQQESQTNFVEMYMSKQ